jgi:ribosomal protein S18 acetylase RimI-like enzyme
MSTDPARPDPAAPDGEGRPELFAAAAATWPPAEIRRLGPWTLRRDPGGGNRVTAATLDGPGGDVAEAEAAMRAWGQTPLFMLRPGDAALDRRLAERGYRIHDPVVLLAAPARALALAGPDERVVLGPAPLAVMREIWGAGGIGPSRLAVMLRAPEPRAFILGRGGDRPAGCGFAAGLGEVAMLHALEVAPFARRAGLGEAITRAAAGWAAEHGFATLALAVTRRNAPALALYARLGMTEAGSYFYRMAPGDPGSA